MRILTVEDDPDLRSGIVQTLREDGYAVDQAADGDEGLHRALAWDYDAIILDIMLPKLDGHQVLLQLRRRKQTPVLFLTARDTVDDRVEGLDLGADDYLVKPFDLSEMLARLRSIIRRSHAIADPTIQVNSIVVNTASRTVSVIESPDHSISIELSPREYALVEMLVMRRGQLVTRTYIYDHLFDDEHDSMSNLVDVYVSRIRRKLGKTFVTTRRGEGYIVPM